MRVCTGWCAVAGIARLNSVHMTGSLRICFVWIVLDRCAEYNSRSWKYFVALLRRPTGQISEILWRVDTL
jgi:hypothetical protein